MEGKTEASGWFSIGKISARARFFATTIMIKRVRYKRRAKWKIAKRKIHTHRDRDDVRQRQKNESKRERASE